LFPSARGFAAAAGGQAHEGACTIFVTDFLDGTVSMISGRSNTVTATIRISAGLEDVAVNLTTSMTYVTDPLRNTVSALSCRR